MINKIRNSWQRAKQDAAYVYNLVATYSYEKHALEKLKRKFIGKVFALNMPENVSAFQVATYLTTYIKISDDRYREPQTFIVTSIKEAMEISRHPFDTQFPFYAEIYNVTINKSFIVPTNFIQSSCVVFIDSK